MTTLDLVDRALPLSPEHGSEIFQRLRSLRDAVAEGRCRIGPSNENSLPCLLGLIMEMMPYSSGRERIVEAIAEHMPGGEMARPQMRMMRYCRSAVATKRSIVKAIENAMLASEAPLAVYGFRLGLMKLIGMGSNR